MTNQQQSQCSFLYQANWFQFSQQFSQHGTNINMKTKTGVMEKELRVWQVSARREEKGVQTDFVVYFGNTSLCFKMREKNTFKKKKKILVWIVCFSAAWQRWSSLWSPSSTDVESAKSWVTDATTLSASSRRPDPKPREAKRSLLLLTWPRVGSDPGTAWANSLCYWHKVQKGSCACIK